MAKTTAKFVGLFVRKNLKVNVMAGEADRTDEMLTSRYKKNPFIEYSGFPEVYMAFEKDGLYYIWRSCGAYGPDALKNGKYDELRQAVEPSVRLRLDRIPREMKKNAFEFNKNVFTKYYLDTVFEPVENIFKNPNNIFVNKKVNFPIGTKALDGRTISLSGAKEFELLAVLFNENGLPRFLVKTYNRVAPGSRYDMEKGDFVHESMGRISRATERLTFFGPECVSRYQDDVCALFDEESTRGDEFKAQLFAEELAKNSRETLYENFCKFHTQLIPQETLNPELPEEAKVDEGAGK